MTNAPSPEIAELLALYDRTHGVAIADIRPDPVAATSEARRAFWRAVWRALDFHTTAPTGSSRLLEVAWPLAAAGGGMVDMLLALHDVVDDALPLSRAYEWMLQELWVAAHCNRDRFGVAFDFLSPIPATQTRRQAYLVLRFAWDAARYTTDDLHRLREQLGRPTEQRLELWLDDRIGARAAREEIAAILQRLVELVGVSDDFMWSTWDDRDEALAELRVAERELSKGERPATLHVLFLPTGDLQEVSLGNGWSDEYIRLADRFDDALKRLDGE